MSIGSNKSRLLGFTDAFYYIQSILLFDDQQFRYTYMIRNCVLKVLVGYGRPFFLKKRKENSFHRKIEKHSTKIFTILSAKT